MQSIIKAVLLGGALSLSAATASAPALAQNAAQKQPAASDAKREASVAAVRIHADWCPSCKALDPKLAEAIAGTSNLPIKHVRFDYTDRNADRLWDELREAGYNDAIGQALDGKIKTGRLVLIDASTGALIDQVASTASVQDIEAALKDAVQDVSA